VSDFVELDNLISYYVSEQITYDDWMRLQDLLRQDQAARYRFRQYFELDYHLARLATPVPEEIDLVKPASRTTTSKWKTWAVAATSLAVSVLFVAGWFALTERKPTWAKVTNVIGEANAHSSIGQRAIRTGDDLRAGESITTSDDALVAIDIADFGTAQLGPASSLEIDDESGNVHLQSGYLEVADVSANPMREIQTFETTAEATDAEFSLFAAQDRALLRVSKGKVRFTNIASGSVEDVAMGNRAVALSKSQITTTPCRSGSILLLTSKVPEHAWEGFDRILLARLLKARLWQHAYRVDMKHYEDVTTEDIQNRALIVVSFFPDGVGEPVLERLKLAELDTPIITLEGCSYPVLGMTESEYNSGFGFQVVEAPTAFEFKEPDHPLSAGFIGTNDRLIKNLYAWGKPSPEALSICQVQSDPNRSMVFAYEKGQSMVRDIAPEKRVAVFIDPTGLNDDAGDQWRFLDAAVGWCVEASNEPSKNQVAIGLPFRRFGVTR
jgi:hypothetical protein